MDLNSATWMVRTLEQPVSALHVTSENQVFAGGWDGRLTLWDDGGEHLWTAQTNDRISAVALSEKAVVVASGLHIVCSTVLPAKRCGRWPSKVAPTRSCGGSAWSLCRRSRH